MTSTTQAKRRELVGRYANFYLLKDSSGQDRVAEGERQRFLGWYPRLR